MRKWRPPDVSLEDEWTVKHQICGSEGDSKHSAQNPPIWPHGRQQNLSVDSLTIFTGPV